MIGIGAAQRTCSFSAAVVLVVGSLRSTCLLPNSSCCFAFALLCFALFLATRQAQASPNVVFFLPKPACDLVRFGQIKLSIDRLSVDFGCMYSFVSSPPRQTLEYFASLNIHIFEVFGQSECTGPMAVSTREAWKMGSCGRPMLVRTPDVVVSFFSRLTALFHLFTPPFSCLVTSLRLVGQSAPRLASLPVGDTVNNGARRTSFDCAGRHFGRDTM